MIFEYVLLEKHGVYVDSKPHYSPKAYALRPAASNPAMSHSEEERYVKEEAEYGEPKQNMCPHINGSDYNVHDLQNVRICWVSKSCFNIALPTFFNINLFRCLNFIQLRGLLRTCQYLHFIRRIEMCWEGFGFGGTIRRLATLVTSLRELRLIFDEHKDEATLAGSPWKILLKTVREKKWHVHLDGEAGWLDKGRQQLKECREMAS